MCKEKKEEGHLVALRIAEVHRKIKDRLMTAAYVAFAIEIQIENKSRKEKQQYV